LMFKYNDLVIHIDPVSREYDYKKLPDADLILVTHEHGDHLDASALDEIVKEGTKTIMTQNCVDNLEDSYDAIVMKNGDNLSILGMVVEAVPAYNIKHTRGGGQPYHPKGSGNGYVLTLGDKSILIGGDTENVPELKKLKDIDIAFLPMNLPYTMTPEMVADLALAVKPKILYPYHYGRTDPQELVELLKDYPEIEVRIRELE
ncbi:MBL fold metallo-hydrolase, partial [Bacteroidota bacterium]